MQPCGAGTGAPATASADHLYYEAEVWHKHPWMAGGGCSGELSEL